MPYLYPFAPKRGYLLSAAAALATFGFVGACGSPPSPQAAAPAAPTAAATSALPASLGAASPSSKGATVKQWTSPPAMEVDSAKRYIATIDTTLGSMSAELFAKDTPKTVNNFVFLSRQGFYDGVTFHRVIKDFMAQTGDPTGTGTGGPGYKFPDEPVTRKYERGTLAMANAGPNTNGSQFFVLHKDYALPPSYTIFGKLSQGLDTLDKIAAAPTGNGRGGANTPATEIKINTVTIAEQ